MRGPIRLILAAGVVALGLIPLSAGAQSTGSTPASPGPKTAVYVFEPYEAGKLNSDINVSQTVMGSCDMASQVDVNRPDAWSCTARGGKTYDPCFVNTAMTELACPDLPAVSSGSLSAASMLTVVIFKPGIPLDPDLANTPGPDATPFLIQLANGDYCVPEPADIRFASLLIFGYCASGYWFGPGDLSKDLWMLPVLLAGSTPSISQLTQQPIMRVWW
jgi:hypothetical protein